MLAGSGSEASPNDSSTDDDASEDAPRSGRRRRRDAGQPRGARSRGANAGLSDEERDDLEAILTVLGTGATMALPVTGLVIVNRAERTSKALSSLAAQNPRVKKVLRRLLTAAKGGDLALVVGQVAVAVGVDAGAIPVQSPVIGLTQIGPEVQVVIDAMTAQERNGKARAQAAGAPPVG